MPSQTISGLNTIVSPASAALMWIFDASASPQDRSLSLASLRDAVNKIVSTSGALGTLTGSGTYVLTGNSTATLPSGPVSGMKFTFKIRGTYSLVLTANSGQTLGDAGASTANAIVIYGNGATITVQWDATNNIWHIVAFSTSVNNNVSGAVGTSTQTLDSFFLFTATGSITLPQFPENGCLYTVKSKAAATVTINAYSGQTIGSTSSTAFLLYAAEDYVQLRYSAADTTWYVVATNGPVQISNQSGAVNCNANSAWTAMGVGLSFGSINPGVYDIDLDCNMYFAGNAFAIAIGNGTTVISLVVSDVYVSYSGQGSPVGTQVVPAHVCVCGYVLSAAAILQGVYYSGNTSNQIYYQTNLSVGRISLRRVG